MRAALFLFVLFATLKLTGVITWSWLWVSMPLIVIGSVWLGIAVVSTIAGYAAYQAIVPSNVHELLSEPDSGMWTSSETTYTTRDNDERVREMFKEMSTSNQDKPPVS